MAGLIIKLLSAKGGGVFFAAGLALLMAALFGTGCWRGYSLAAERGRAALTAERLERTEQDIARASALLEAEALTRERIKTAQDKADAAERDYLALQERFLSEQAIFDRRIEHAVAAAGETCVGLPDLWVREYIRALTGNYPLPGPAGSPIPDTAPAAVAATGAE